MTPPEDGSPQEEDWPTIEPAKSDTNLPYRNQSQVKPSLGESLYEGMRALNLQEKENNIEQEPKNRPNDTAAARPHDALDTNENQDTNPDLLTDGKTRPLSSSQLPKPRDSMLQSLSRHADSPAIRQTKTSTLRLQQATGKAPWDPNEKKKLANSHIPTIRERAGSPSEPRSKQDFHGGPVRTNSRGRYGVTGRGSPYTIPSRSNIPRKPVPRDEVKISRRDLHTPRNSQLFEPREERNSLYPSTSPKQQVRKSSIRLLARVARQTANLVNEEELSEASPTGHSMSLPVAHQQEAHGLTANLTHAPVTHGESDDHSCELSPAAQSELLNVKEVLSTPVSRDDESFVDSDEDESGSGTHGYDSFGGYRVRRIGNGSNMGPTLRITDSASRILLGDEHAENILAARSPNVTLRHKGSAPDIGSPRVVKDQGRRSSAIFTSPMTLVRQLTDRSSSQHKHVSEDETRNLMDADSSVDTVVYAELPDSEVKISIHPATNSEDDFDAGDVTLHRSSTSQHTPKSDHGDWPGKDFADFNVYSESLPTTSKGQVPSAEVATGPPMKRPMPSRSPSRPPTIVLREAPSKETAPFLFQDLEREQAKQEKLADDLAKAAGSGSESSIAQPSASTSTVASSVSPFPPRTSSRKPKPPPIIVSPPTVSFLASQAPKAVAMNPSHIKKPRNVKTFSQSISPKTETGIPKGRKISGVLSHSPSTSNKKKVVDSLRGLWKKKSFEANKAAGNVNAAGNDETVRVKRVEGEAEPMPSLHELYRASVAANKLKAGRGSFRRSPLPKFTAEESQNKFANPLHLHPTSTQASGAGDAGTAGRTLKHKNAFISPTTPWTANLKTSKFPSSPLATATLENAYASSPTTSENPTSPSPTVLNHAHPSPRSPISPSPLTANDTPILSTATSLTHTLLDLARSSTNTAEKSRLIELSKCMVEVVSSARDAEKAMEKARMEASRAEVAYLKCLQEVSAVEGVVGRIMGETQSQTGMDGDGRRVKDV